MQYIRGMVSHKINPAQLIQAGFQHHKAGRLQQAEQIYRQVIAQDKGNAEANHLLGIIACQRGRYETGVQLIRKAVAASPRHSGAHKSLGKALKELGQLDDAAASLRRALELNPLYAEAHIDLGIVLKDLGQFDEARTNLDKAVSLNPSSAEAHYNLGNLLYEQGAFTEAAACFQKAISLKPSYVEAFNNLGNTLRQQKLFDEALASFYKALALNPDYAEAHNNLGNLFNEQGQLAEAAVHCRRAIALKPEFAEAYSNLGNALMQQGFLTEAVASFQKSLALNPHNMEARSNFSQVLLRQGRLAEAEIQNKEALARQPEHAEARIGLGHVLREQGCLAEAVANYRRALKSSQIHAHANLLFTLNYLPDITQEEIYNEALRWADSVAGNIPLHKQNYANSLIVDRRLRIGYVSPDFRAHSVAFFIESVLRAHDREMVEIFCYANVKKPDSISERIKAASDHWFSIVRMDHEAVVRRITKDAIDILVDLAGHTSDNSLPVFARKPAPVQVSWLGYPNTTGLRTIDYRLTDSIADPVDTADSFYSEKLVRLDHGFLCYQPDASAPEVAKPPFSQHDLITFGSFNNITKVGPDVIKTWARILHAVPDSRLILKAKQFIDESTRSRFVKMIVLEGIEASRLELYGRLPKQADHLQLYSRIDIGLDPFPYNGTTTTCEALWMGVPVVTLLGNRHACRVGASILHRVGLKNLVAASVDDYVMIARKLADDRQRLQDLRIGLRQRLQDSELMNSRQFTAHLEDVYRRMWRQYCDSAVQEPNLA